MTSVYLPPPAIQQEKDYTTEEIVRGTEEIWQCVNARGRLADSKHDSRPEICATWPRPILLMFHTNMSMTLQSQGVDLPYHATDVDDIDFRAQTLHMMSIFNDSKDSDGFDSFEGAKETISRLLKK